MSSNLFWKPKLVTHQQVVQEERRGDESAGASAFNFLWAPLARQRLMLPIYKHKKQILYAVEEYNVVVIVGETGSGKSTQLLQYLNENGWAENGFQLLCTQPRRIAAQSLAGRVAQEMGCRVGQEVGYSVRFDECCSPATRIKFATDGMILREASLHDPLLSNYSVIMIDEAHERSCNSDALLGIVKKIRRKRRDLRVIICSATIDAERFLDFFVPKQTEHPPAKKSRWGPRIGEPAGEEENIDRGTIISVDGRQHPVDIQYLSQPVSDYIRACVDTALAIHQCETDGDILVFLPSGEDIDRAIKLTDDLIHEIDSSMKIACMPLYGTLPYHMQAAVFQPKPSSEQSTRRVIFATNIAETSVTVPDIGFVVDSGFAKIPFFDTRNGFERLSVAPVSRASCRQRAGRAGRVRSGKCFRLFTEKYMLEKMEDTTPPEVMRTNMTGFILTLKTLGVDNILGFDLMDTPTVDSLSHGLESLYALGAIDDKTQLTEMGQRMSAFPTEPRVARMLLASLEYGCSWEVLGVASAMQVRALLVQPRTQRQRLDYDTAVSDIVDRSGDHVTYVNLVSEMEDRQLDQEECKERFINYVALKRALEIRTQLARILRRYGEVRAIGLSGDEEERSRAIRKCVLAGFFFHAAKLGNDGRYYTLRGKRLITPNKASVLHSYGAPSEYIVFCETVDGSRGGIETRFNSTIEARWLRELAPHYWE